MCTKKYHKTVVLCHSGLECLIFMATSCVGRQLKYSWVMPAGAWKHRTLALKPPNSTFVKPCPTLSNLCSKVPRGAVSLQQ